ncbi:MAG: ferredoxin [Pseudomonadota bacterium]
MDGQLGSSQTLREARALLAPFGMLVFGAFRHGDGYGLLVGGIGGSFWAAFSSADHMRDGEAHPLDRWTVATLEPIAAQLEAKAVYPFGQPFQPFQRWAREATGMEHSPLGLLVHPEYGLWCSFRGALLFAEGDVVENRTADWHPCDRCVEKPCLSTCPVSAFSADGFDVAACRDHIGSAAGLACREAGCLARKACPVGAQYAYEDVQQRFHMGAFRGG